MPIDRRPTVLIDGSLDLCCIGRAETLGMPWSELDGVDIALRTVDVGGMRAIAIDRSMTGLKGTTGRSDADTRSALNAAASVREAEWRRCHAKILRAALRTDRVVPIRFGQVFSSPSALESMLRKDGHRYEDALDRVAGASEYRITLQVNRIAARWAMGRGLPVWFAADDAALDAWIAPRVSHVIDALDAVARMSCRHRIEHGATFDGTWSFLVDDQTPDALQRVLELASEAGDDGIEWTATGPEPACSFAPAPRRS
ncbi:MAG: GvpL/GvpF family gas vesicle protein [Phycisphaerales bacterium]